MSAVTQNITLRAAARQCDNAYPYDDTAERRGELSDELADAIKRDPSFIGEALQEDCTALVAAYAEKDGQAALDALADMVDSWLASNVNSQLNRRDYFASDYPRTELAALENIARLCGVSA